MKLLFLLCFISQLSFGQEKLPIDKNIFNLRIAPFSLLDIYNGSCYKGGFEINLHNQTSLTFEVGGYFKNFNNFSNIQGHIIDVGLRKYMLTEDNSGTYVSFNTTYKNQAFNYQDSFGVDMPIFKTYRTQKYVTTMNFNLGYQNVTKRMTLDLFIGLGVRLKNVRSTLTKDELNLGKEYQFSQSLFFLVTPDKYVLPNINLGIRVGFRIK